MSATTGVLMLAYRQADYIGYSLRAIASEVDVVVVVHSSRPFVAYNPRARVHFGGDDGTLAILKTVTNEMRNVVVVSGEWNTEEDMRNVGLDALRGEGVTVCLIVDADEFYPTGHVARIRRRVNEEGAAGEVYWAHYKICYRRFDYVVDAPGLILPVAMVLDDSSRFVNRRIPEGKKIKLGTGIYYWHMGYVLSDERMWEKINTFGHSHEIAHNWFREKWLEWTPFTENLGRVFPEKWPRTVQIDPFQLPAILHRHKFFPSPG